MQLTPYAVAYVFPYKLVVVPMFIIFTALALIWLVRSPSSRGTAGALLFLLGLTEAFGTIPTASVAVLFLGLATMGIGIALSSYGVVIGGRALALNLKVPVVLILLGVLAMLVAILAVSFFAMVVALGAFICGITLGIVNVASRIKDASLKSKVASTLILSGIIEIIVVEPSVYAWGFVFGFGIILAGAGLGASVFQAWFKRHLNEQNKPKLKRALSVALVVVVLASASVAMARAANLIHEVPESGFTSATSPNIAARGVVSDVKVNYLVDWGYTYHIFPAYITLTVSEVTLATEQWKNNLTAANEFYQGKTVIVDCETTNLPQLSAGQQVEVTGYMQSYWVEDSMFNGMLIVGPTVSGSRIVS